MLRLQRLQQSAAPAQPTTAAAQPPLAAVAAAAQDGQLWAASAADGLLHLLDTSSAATSSSPLATFALCLDGQRLPALIAAVCPLPSTGLLLAQRGSGHVLFCPDPAGLAPGEAVNVFQFGSHEAPVAAIAASPCGSFVLSVDARGALTLWSAVDGERLAGYGCEAGGGGNSTAAAAAACFLPDGTVAAAQLGGGSVVVHSVFSGDLRLRGELAVNAGDGRRVTALVAAGPLLAVGCSDGSVQLWRCANGELEQQALVPASQGGTAGPITCLSLSTDAALLAAAAGPAVSICDAATGTPLAARALDCAPAALHWGPGDQLLAPLPSGALQRLGATDQAAPPAAVSAQLQPPSPRKTVRFAEQLEMEPRHAGSASSPRRRLPQPFESAPQPISAAGSARAGPPPLPDHPLLRRGSSFSQPPPRFVPSSLDSMRGRAQPAGAVLPSKREPLYPILDLRALQGLQAAAPASLPASPAKPAARQAACRPVSAAARPAAVATTRAVRHAGTCTEPGLPDMSAWQQPVVGDAPPAAATSSQQQPQQQSGEEGEDEAPRQPRLPSPLRRQRSPPPPRVSKQQCDACRVLAAVPGPSGSRPASPAKAALLAQLAEQREGAAGPGCSRPASPLKLGVECTLEAQEGDGELQPDENRAFTVLEHDVPLAHSTFPQQRVARISRRCVFAAAAAEEEPGGTAGKAVDAEHAQLVAEAREPEPQQAAAALAPGSPAAQQQGQSELPTVAPAGAAGGAEPPAFFAVGSDVELAAEEEGDGGPAAEAPQRWGQGSTSPHGSMPEAAAMRSRQQQREAVSTEHSRRALGQLSGALGQLDSKLGTLAARAQRRPVSPALPPPVVLPTRQAADIQPPLLPKPGSLLAVPAPCSSVLLAYRRQRQQEQAVAAASRPLPEQQQAELRRLCATAAATLSPKARLFSALPPPVAEAAVEAGSKESALAGARKKLDARWVEEQQDLRPAPWAPPKPPPPLPGPLAIAVPLPSARELVAGLLGLKL